MGLETLTNQIPLIRVVLDNEQFQTIHFSSLPAGKFANAVDLQYADALDQHRARPASFDGATEFRGKRGSIEWIVLPGAVLLPGSS
jgi:hypothetical protein